MIHRITILVCPLLVVAMTIAVWHHSRSVKRITMDPVPHRPIAKATAPKQATKAQMVKQTAIAPTQTIQEAAPVSQPSQPQREFYASMLKQIESLQNQDLLDQLAETNRELMKLEFRVDTHSSQFRPLPVTEERLEEVRFDDSSGLLPPRPVMIDGPFGE